MVYVVHPDQSKQVIAAFPIGGLLNGMTPDDDGNLYIADSFAGVIWRVSSGGGTPVVWIDLHAPGSLQGGLGPNGIKFDKYKRNLYVTLMKLQEIVRVPIDRDGEAGTPEIFVSNITSSDDFCFDQIGNLYLATQGGPVSPCASTPMAPRRRLPPPPTGCKTQQQSSLAATDKND